MAYFKHFTGLFIVSLVLSSSLYAKSTDNYKNNCLTITNSSSNMGAWWSNGSFDIKNNCTTAQTVNGIKFVVSSSDTNLVPSNFQLSSISNITPWVSSSVDVTTEVGSSGNTQLLTTINADSKGKIAVNSSINVSFGYAGNGTSINPFSYALYGESTPIHTGKVAVTITNPNSSIFSAQTTTVNLIKAPNTLVASGNVLFGIPYVFNNVESGKYYITTNGLADAKNGIYYKNIKQDAIVVANKITNANLIFTPDSTKLVNTNIASNGLSNGDIATITIVDNNNNYSYNNIIITGNTSTSINLPIKLLLGNTITLSVNASGYQIIPPITYVVESSNPIVLNFIKNPVLPTVYSAYKDIGINANWSQQPLVISTLVNPAGGLFSSPQPLATSLPKTMPAVTLAFATGDCTNATWNGVKEDEIASNLPLFVKAGKNYIISTGGANGSFTCSSNTGMVNFIKRYMTKNMIGIDFDIEGHGLTPSQITDLISTLQYAQRIYPDLRISFTLATLADSTSSAASIVPGGVNVIQAANAANLNYVVNLMVMDYGSVNPTVCVVNQSDNSCDMGKSAIQAAENLHKVYNIPYNKIELTPMIGINDVTDEFFTLEDIKTITNYINSKNLAGLHFWSYDRDTPCPAGQTYVSTECTFIPGVTTTSAQFSNSFYNGLLLK